MIKQLHLFVLISFLLGIVAPACGFAWGNNGGGKYSVVEICTAQGIENRVVESEDQQNTPMMAEQCEFCFASANLKSFLPSTTSFETVFFEYLKAKTYSVYISNDKFLSFDHTPRAPPVFV